MKNPFSGEPGEDEAREREGAGDPIAPPEDRQEAELEPAAADEHAATDEPPDDPDEPDDRDEGGQGKEAQMITAPSIGPNTVIERRPPEERLDFDKISATDAMGKDKRRQVVGRTYGPTRARVFGTFAAFIAIVAALTVGFYFLAQELDAPPAENPDVAPWSAAEAPQKPPKPLQ